MNSVAREAEDVFNRNDHGPAFWAIKRLSPLPAPGVNMLLKVDGTVILGHEGCRARHAECFEELYKVPSPAKSWAGGVQRTVMAPVLPIREDPQSSQEVERMVCDLKGAELPGCAGSPPNC